MGRKSRSALARMQNLGPYLHLKAKGRRLNQKESSPQVVSTCPYWPGRFADINPPLLDKHRLWVDSIKLVN
jgi:hypothetical protein